MVENKRTRISQTEESWKSPRWDGIKRDYTALDVEKVKGSIDTKDIKLGQMGAEKLWKLFKSEPYVRSAGAATPDQAVQMVFAGLNSVYVSGWQTAADNNQAGEVYPDQSLYPVTSVPKNVQAINNALTRADQISHLQENHEISWFVPIVADAEAGFGGKKNAYELMKGMIVAGAAGVHFEDQLASEKKCGHMVGKVLIPTYQAIRNLKAARLAADVLGASTILIARTDADSAKYLSNDFDPYDSQFLTGKRVDGFFEVKNGVEAAISRGLAFAPYSDLLWMETSTPDLGQAKAFADAIHDKHPGKYLAYNCSPSFKWKKFLNDKEIAEFQDRLGEMGYKFIFITLFGYHTLNYHTFMEAKAYSERGMSAFVKLQEAEFAAQKDGYTYVRHQESSGTGYFDEIDQIISGGESATTALQGSTETEQFDR